MRAKKSFRPTLEQMEDRLAPAVIASWTDDDGKGDGLWTTAANWIDQNGQHNVPRSAGDWAYLQGSLPDADWIPGPVIPAGAPITLWALNTVGTFTDHTLVISGTLTIDRDPESGMPGGVMWTAGNIQLTQQSAALNILNGSQVLFIAGSISDSGFPLSTVTVNGVAPNGAPSKLDLALNFSEIDANVVIGNMTTTGQGLMVVENTVTAPVTLGGGASITLNKGGFLALYPPQGNNDTGIAAAGPSDIINGAGDGFVVNTDAAGSGNKAIQCPAVIGGSSVQGNVFVRWTKTTFAVDCRGRSIVLNGTGVGDNQLSWYEQYPNTQVTCAGNMMFTYTKLYFDSGGSNPATDRLTTPYLFITNSSKLYLGSQGTGQYVYVLLTGDFMLYGSTCYIDTNANAFRPDGDFLQVSGDAYWGSNSLIVTCNISWRNNQNFEFIYVIGSLTGDSNNTVTGQGNGTPANGWTVVTIGNNDGSTALDLQN